MQESRPADESTGRSCVLHHSEENSRFTFAATYVATCLILLVSALTVNFFGNANDLFPSPLRPAVSDRAWKTRRLEHMVRTESPPKVMILGSSRIIQVCPSYIEAITRKKTFNYAVTGGNMIDCLAHYRYALKIGAKPDLIILNVDEGMLAQGPSRGNLRMVGHLGLFSEAPAREKWRILLSVVKGLDLDVTMRSIRALLRTTSLPDERVLQQTNFIFLEDGYRINPRRAMLRHSSTFALDEEIKRDLSEHGAEHGIDFQDDKVPMINHQMKIYLHELMKSSKEEGIDVHVITTPEHPSVRQTKRGNTRRQLLKPLTEHLQAECSQFGFLYRDFSDLASFSGDPDEFWDSVHQTPVNIQRMMNALFGIDPKTEVVSLPSDIELLRRLGIKPPPGES
jgi:hypothetical protein